MNRLVLPSCVSYWSEVLAHVTDAEQKDVAMPINLDDLPVRQRRAIEELDPETRRAVELLAEVQARGFIFHRFHPADPAVFGTRETALWRDTVRIDGIGFGCSAQRSIKDTAMTLEPVAAITGSAADVMIAVLNWT